MNKKLLTIKENSLIAPKTFKMVLEEPAAEFRTSSLGPLPGQFINIKLEGFYLRRPISICDHRMCVPDEQEGILKDQYTIIYKTVGHGTEALSQMQPGETLDVLTELGNGFDIRKAGAHPLLVGGGAGVPPMYRLASWLLAAGRDVRVILGFNTAEEVFYEEEFLALNPDTSAVDSIWNDAPKENEQPELKLTITTTDGSYGQKGYVTDAVRKLQEENSEKRSLKCAAGHRLSGISGQDEAEQAEAYSYVYACGPIPMLKALDQVIETSGQFSFEERMGCGFGACMGCTCRTKYGNKRICTDGPVLEREEIIW